MTNPLPAFKSVTVSIVSHGQQALIRPLLEQLDRHSHQWVAVVVLTLNIPETDLLTEAEEASWRFPIRRLVNSTPHGFGANHNQGFQHCGTPWFLVLNPDIRFDCDVLAPLLAQAAPDAGLLTPRVQEPGKLEPEQHRALLTPLEILTRNHQRYRRPPRPAGVPGLFMLFRSEAYRHIAGFDEKRFFMYGEDFDICARLRLAGWKIQVGEDLQIRHEAQRASRRRSRHLYWHLSSLVKVWLSSAFWRLRRLEASNRSD